MTTTLPTLTATVPPTAHTVAASRVEQPADLLVQSDATTPASTGAPVETTAITIASTGSRPRPADALERGTIVGRYIVFSRIGVGGMGVVYAAYDPELDRKVALKLLLSETPGQAWLLREAQAMARLSHPNICAVYDVGTFYGQVFLAMELIDGVLLRTWLNDQPRTRQAILATFEAIGCGLVAAHAEGVVHRDLKPENIMIGADGRPRVMDFGIAQTGPREIDPMPSSPGHATAADQADDGPLHGTPQYMAPEQRRGGTADPRSDQFSFCVTLWEALYGERPFVGSNVGEIPRGAERGPRAPGAPPWLRRVLARGLASAPEQRFPTMEALLAALASGQGRRRRVIATVLAAGLLSVVAVVLGARTRERQQAVAACEAAGAGIFADTWSAETRARLRARLVVDGAPDAGSTFSRVAAWIDPFAQRWRQERVAACLAGETRTVVCLHEQQQELAALIEVLSDHDPRAAPRAVAAAAALPDPAACAGRATEVPGPRDPGDVHAWPRAARLRRQLHRARNLGTTDRPAEALALADQVLGEAVSSGERAVMLSATLVAGDMADRTGDYTTAERLLRRATIEAGAAGFDDVAADAATRLLRTVGLSLARHSDGLLIADFAAMLVRRTSQDERLRGARLLGAMAALQRERRELVASQVLYERSLEILERELGREHPEVALTIDQMGIVFKDRGEYREAIRLHTAARTLSEAVYGPEHPEVAACLMNLAIAHTHLGEQETARELLTRALATLERALGPKHPTVARARLNVGNTLYYGGKHAEALQEYQAALAILEAALGPKHPDLAIALGNIGNVQQTRGELGEAERNYRRALAILQEALGPEHPRLVPVLQGLGQLAMQRERPDQALEPFERSVRIGERVGLPVQQLADARAGLAQAVWAVRGDRAETLRLAGLAAAAYRTLGEARAPVLAMLEAWASDLPVTTARDGRWVVESESQPPARRRVDSRASPSPRPRSAR